MKWLKNKRVAVTRSGNVLDHIVKGIVIDTSDFAVCIESDSGQISTLTLGFLSGCQIIHLNEKTD